MRLPFTLPKSPFVNGVCTFTFLYSRFLLDKRRSCRNFHFCIKATLVGSPCAQGELSPQATGGDRTPRLSFSASLYECSKREVVQNKNAPPNVVKTDAGRGAFISLCLSYREEIFQVRCIHCGALRLRVTQAKSHFFSQP